MTSFGREVDVGGTLPINELVSNSEALIGEVQYHSTMKSCTLFKRGPSPLRPPRVRQTSLKWLVFPGLPCFSRSFAYVYYIERKPKNKKGTRLGSCDIQNYGLTFVHKTHSYWTLQILHSLWLGLCLVGKMIDKNCQWTTCCISVEYTELAVNSNECWLLSL